MIELGIVNDRGVLPVTIRDELTQDDVEQAAPRIHDLLEGRSELRFLIRLEQVSGEAPGELWEEVKFDSAYASRFGRTAIVGERDAQDWGDALSDTLFGEEMRFFLPEEEAQALEWVNADG